jgi:D-alanyl-D-alanine dipeptidase
MKRRISGTLFRLLPVLFLVLRVCNAQPPEEKGKVFHRDDLVELVKLDTSLRLDIRYATSNNFMHRPMYTQARAFLQRDAAKALVRVSRKLNQQGYGLLIFDGYRPWSITKKFWDETPAEKHNFVADPRKGSKHNRGCAVDLSLYNLRTGKEISMPSPYDDFTERAYPFYKGGTVNQRRMRNLLRVAMEKEGFTVNEFEWWHFDFKDWARYRISDVPFENMPR